VLFAALRNIRIATTTVAFALLIYTAVSVAQLSPHLTCLGESPG